AQRNRNPYLYLSHAFRRRQPAHTHAPARSGRAYRGHQGRPIGCRAKGKLMTDRLLDFVVAIHDLVEQPELPLTDLLDSASQHMKRLTAHDDWLPAAMAQPHADRYQQYLLYGDPLERFSVVSFVWGPGQSTPVHDHTVWGVIGVLRGSEISAPYRQ